MKKLISFVKTLSPRELYLLGVLILIGTTLPTRWVQLNSIFILLLLGFWLFDRKKSLSTRNLLVILSVGAIYLVYCLSLLYSANTSRALSHLETRFSLLALPLIMVSSYQLDLRRLHVILLSFLIATLLLSVVCLVHTIYLNQISGRNYMEQYHWFYSSDSLVGAYGFHPSYFSIYCSFCIFIVLYFYKNKCFNIILTAGLILYLILFQMLLASRIGILAFIIVFMLTLLYDSLARRKILNGIFTVLVFFFMISLCIYSFPTLRAKFFAVVNYDINVYTEAYKINKRFESWTASWDIVQGNPVFGVGVGDAKDELKERYFETGFIEGYELSYDSHNLFLETLVSCGVLGSIALMLLFVVSFMRALKYKNILHIQFLVLFIILSIAEASLSVQKGVVFFSFFNTIFIASMLQSERFDSLMRVNKEKVR